MTDRQKWEQITSKIEALKDIHPATYQLWLSVYGGIKEQVEQALQKNEETNSSTQVHTAGQ